MAEAIVGFNTAIGLRTETTYGTDPAAGTVWLEFISENVVREFETLAQVDTRAPVERNNASQSRERVTGAFDVYVNSENIGHLLFYILGTAAAPVQQGATAAYLHALTPTTTATKSFTYEADYGEVSTEAKVATGCKLNSLTIDLADGLVTCSAGLAGKTLTEDGAATAITFKSWPRSFDFKDFALTIDGTDESVDVIGGTISFSRANVEDDFRQGSQQIQSIPTGVLSVEVTLDLMFDPAAATTTQDFLDGTATDKTVVITYTGDVAATGYDHTMKFTFPNCYAEGGSPVISGAGEKVQRSVRIKPLHGYGSGEEVVKVELTNLKSSVYA